MASQFSSRQETSSFEKRSRRSRLRRVLLESLERRELLAADFPAGPIFAPGTSQAYVDSVLEQYLGTNAGNQDFQAINLSGSRWTDPVGGPSPNQGDPATVTWSIVPDGTLDTSGGGSIATNLVNFLDNIYGGGTGPVEQRPWFNIIERVYNNWSDISGLNFVYEPNDDGVPIDANNRGISGVRGDVRIGGRAIDGNSGILAFNYIPVGGGTAGFDGDMIIDTNDSFYFNNADGPSGENRGLTNVLTHEAGHGNGLLHVIPVNETKLMEPFVSFAFIGPQHDDLLATQALYGDDRENDDALATATDLGELGNGPFQIAGGSIDRVGDDDWMTFSVPSAGRITVTLEPLGEQYDVGPQGGTAGPVNTLLNQDLSFELLYAGGALLASVDTGGLGEIEQLDNFDLPAGGTYHLRVIGSGTPAAEPQLYDLRLQLSGLTGTGALVQPPRLLSVAPNVGEIFSFNRTDELDVSPNELQFRFDGSQFLDASSFDGIRITRSGFDGDFNDGDEIIINPGFIGFGESERIIIARFASPLPDDLYRVEVFGVDIPSEGIIAVRNVTGDMLQPRIQGTDRDTVFFNLELGNEIVAIVPQPTSRDTTTGSILQARDQIEVYFSDGDLMHPSDVATGQLVPNPTVVDPTFYKLFADRGTVSNNDDALYNPTTIQYFADRNMAVLTFAADIDQLDPTQDTSFRLRIGTNEARPAAPVVIAQPTDPGSTFASAGSGSTNLGVFSALTSIQLNQEIVNPDAFPLDFPGAPDTPGDREVLNDPSGGESHFLDDNPDTDVGLTRIYYTFNKVESFGTNTSGQPLFNSITLEQESRAREIFEFYGSQLGIDFVETSDTSLPDIDGDGTPERVIWIITGELDGPGGALAAAGGNLAVMDASVAWDDSFGQSDDPDPNAFSWFGVAMHEIGHLLGLGHATELPPGTNMGGFYSDVTLGGEARLLFGNDSEPIYPGPHDVAHGQYLHRPDSRDIDMYRFEIAAGQAGAFSAEVVAERLSDSSTLDSVLTLYRERADGTREIIAANDDYFSDDSYLNLDLSPGIYYLGVTSSGNTDFDPTITDSGLGGTSEGAYQLRTTFRPLVASSIVDTAGTPLDGDSDGIQGGVFNFWFNTANPTNTIFVDKLGDDAGANGSITNPFNTISSAFAAAQPGDIVRIVPNGGVDGVVATQEDNFAFEVGRGGLGSGVLDDGEFMNLPRGVTVMVDAGALFKMGRSIIGVGSSTSSGDQSRAAMQVLGTPEQQVFFTSYTDENLGVDTDPLSTTASPGDWGGIIFRNSLDRAEGRFDAELDGRFLNYVAHANMQHGGGQVSVDGQPSVVTPLHMVTARPTLIHNQITRSSSAAVSANPNSFQETTFAIPRFQSDDLFTPDYVRVGPEIHDNRIVNNSINGLFVRVETPPGQRTSAQTVAGRWNDTDIVHVIADTLTVAGTPGGPFVETRRPELATVQQAATSVAGGQLIVGPTYTYRMAFVDANGNESLPSNATQGVTLSAGSNAIRLSNLTPATSGFVARRLYRSAGGAFQLVAELDRSSAVHVDGAAPRGTVLDTTAQTVNRARLDASLVVDPGMIVKLQGGRIVGGIGAQVVAEGQDGLPVIFTSRQDDTYGAGSTFDTNSDGSISSPQPGDWGGIYFGQMGTGSLDFALVTYGGGVTGVGGTFAGFNAIEIHQANVRISNSIIEENAAGTGGPSGRSREGFGFNEDAAIFVRGSQPIIVDNIIRDNSGPAISIDPHSTSSKIVKDGGRVTGLADRLAAITENKGPLVRGNALGNNAVNAMVLRGVTLNNESVLDDTDIVHAIFDEIVVPDFHISGGLRLQSSPDESLVVKFGPGAGLTSIGRPLDISDRIGGTLQVLGSPGFPVILTSVADDSVGAGFDPFGASQTDTNNDGASTVPRAGDWRSLKIDELSNDRNVAVAIELEPAQSAGAGVNGIPGTAQNLGLLAANEKSGDDNLRLGYTVVGTVNNPDDVDVYSFTGTAGTQVWLDIDRTATSLDAVVELVDANGNILAQSDNSFDESRGALPLVNNLNAINHVNAMQTDLFSPRNGGNPSPFGTPIFPGDPLLPLTNTFTDFQTTNPLDPGMRIVLPGATGSVNPYFVRVRSSNIDSRDPAAVRADLEDPTKLSDGKTEGQYQLQIRLRESDELAGSGIAFADIRYATIGIEILGQPGHSPLAGEAAELTTNNDVLANALDLGGLLSTDRAALAVAGELSTATDVDWYKFSINQDSIQDSGLVQHLSTIIDVDYADGFSRANTSLWLFYDDQNGIGSGTNTGIRLVNFGTDSNIADDIGAPLNGSDTDDLSRGSAGLLDAFIGSSSLPSGDYYLAITSNQLISSYLGQYFNRDASGNPLVRVEPINSVTRVIEDRFGGSTTTADLPLQVGFSGTASQVEYTLADLQLFISQPGPGGDTSELITVSAMTGTQISEISRFGYVEDLAVRGDGTIHASRSPQTGVQTDAVHGGILDLDWAGDGSKGTGATSASSGIQTFVLDTSVNPPAVASAFSSNGQRNGAGMEFLGLTYPQQGNTQWLYAVGSRVVGGDTFRSFTGFSDAWNYIYKLDPTSLAATSAPQADRTDNARLGGAGTQIRERGYVDTSQEVSPNVTYQTVIMDAASPANAPSLLDGDIITLNTPNGLEQFEWTSAVLSATLIADTAPQANLNQFPPAPTRFFRDGETFTLTAGATTETFEIDTGRILENNYQTLTAPATYDLSTFVIVDGDGDLTTFEFDAGGNGATLPGAVPVPYDAANSTQLQVSQAIVNAINGVNPGTITVLGAGNTTWDARAALLPGTNRISVTHGYDPANPAGIPDLSAMWLGSVANDPNANPPVPVTFAETTTPNPLTISELTISAGLLPGQTYDGATLTMTDLDGDVFVFEFDTNGSIAATSDILVPIQDTSTANFIASALQSAINFPTGGVPVPAWNVNADPVNFNSTFRLLGDARIELSPSTATVANPLLITPEFGTQFDPAANNVLVPVEEYYVNVDDVRFLPIPSTPGAMDELVLAINNSPIGASITASSIGTRLELNGATAADFSGIQEITSNAATGVGTPLPFTGSDTAFTLNQTLLANIQAVEPLAQQLPDGRIWLPARSSFIQTLSDDRYDRPNSKNAQFSEPQKARLQGLAFAGNTMFGVSEDGDLYRIGSNIFSSTFTFNANNTFNNGDFIDTIYKVYPEGDPRAAGDFDAGDRVNFVGLSSGPRNVEGGSLANTLFGIDSRGVVYAFDTQGRPRHIFQNGDWFIQTDASNPTGLTFSNLDVNLWHETTNNRNTDDGHGVNVSFDGNRRTQQDGSRSLYFGFEDPKNSPTFQTGTWTGVNDPGANFPGYDPLIYDTYDFPNGTKGSVVSNPLNLAAYGPGDKPFLYFNYYLGTENANATNPGDNNFMKDSFRVFASGSDGQWKLIGTNNSDYDAERLVGQFDELDYLLDNDPLLQWGTGQISEIYDANETFGGSTSPDSWRQARIDLSRFAGDENIRIRFDFSTSGSFDVGSLAVGGSELLVFDGSKFSEGQTFQIDTAGTLFGFTAPDDDTIFEFDLGLVLQVPSGASLEAGQTFEVDGVTYTFATDNVGDNVLFTAADTPAAVAARIVAKLQARALNATVDPINQGRISVLNATNATPVIDPALLAKGFLQGVPGVGSTTTPSGVVLQHVPVLINNSFTYQQVRDAIRTSMAGEFNIIGQETNIAAIRFHEQSIFLWDKTVVNPGPLGLSQSLQGDEFGERPAGGPTNQLGLGAQRGQNNRFEGVYIDDIIVGFAERGEMVTYEDNSTASVLDFEDNPQHEPGPGLFLEIETGTYQIEIRRGATYGIGGPSFPNLGLLRSFDTNDRLAQTVSLVAPSGYQIFDGQTFTLSDGIDTITFEYNDQSITVGPFSGVAQGNVELPFNAADDANTIAETIRDTINGAQVQATLGVVAGLSDGATGPVVLGRPTESRVIHLHGSVSANNAGSSTFGGTPNTSLIGANQPGFVLHGLDNFAQTDIGDSNLFRDQGAVIVHSNVIRDSANYGIVVDAGARVNNTLAPLAGALAHPGSVRNLFQINSQDLIPGPVLINNLIYANAVGGILFSGDSRNNNMPEAPVPFGRILNNTVVGNSAGIGINVTDNASPTLLNNIVSSFATGVQVDNTSTTTVVGATTYHNNSNDIGGSLPNRGTDSQQIGPSEPLFVNSAGRNYYLAADSRAIDASIDSLNDRGSMTIVRDPLGIGFSPILAPDADITGQLRVDDPNVSNPNGTGGNPFKDRGAYDRADFFGPQAVLQQPIDNDPDFLDVDRTNTVIRLNQGTLNFFSILLVEPEGTGPDPSTVTSQSVTITQNGRLLKPNVDYVFGYNAGSRLIRLTPLAGIWRSDSVYEITLINQDGIRLDVPNVPDLADGVTFDVDVDGNVLTFEFDTDGTVASGSLPVAFDLTMSQYELATRIEAALNNAGAGLLAFHQGDNAVMVHGATGIAGLATTTVPAITDIAENPLQANRISSLTQFTIAMPEVQFDYGDAPGAGHRTVGIDAQGRRTLDASRHALLPVDAPKLVLGTYVDGENDGQPSSAAYADDMATASVSSSIVNSKVDIAGPALLRMQTVTAATDGQRITIVDPLLQSVTFEFDTAPNPGSVSPGTTRVAVSMGDTAAVAAEKFRKAVNQSVLIGDIEGLNPFANADVLNLGGTSAHIFDLSASPTAAIRIPQSDFKLTLPGDIADYSDGDTVSVTDTVGRTAVFELNDLASPGIFAQGRVPVGVDLTTGTPEEVATAFANAINLEIAAGRLSLAPVQQDALELSLSGDDEDGVFFGGLFNANSRPVPVTVNTVGNGLLTVWFDWNGDGDFADSGERLASATNLPVSDGSTTLMVTTPAIAQSRAEAFQAANPGERFFIASRFRLSTNGTPLLGGLGIGGETEDYMVEIVVGAPPVANDDSYSTLEDESITIVAPGVLQNDTNNSVSQLTVVDENPATTAVDIQQDVQHGTLVINLDGSFTYTPDADYSGEDTFIYNITDARLVGGRAGTVTITVAPINDPPVFTILNTVDSTEDQGLVTIPDFATDMQPGPATPDEVNQTFTIHVEAVDSSAFSVQPQVADDGTLTFQTAPNVNSNNADLRVKMFLTDDGVDTPLPNNNTSPTRTFTIVTEAINDAPDFDLSSTQVSVIEDEEAFRGTTITSIPAFAANIIPGPAAATDEQLQIVSFTTVTVSAPELFEIQPSISAAGELTFKTAANKNGNAIVVVQARDDGLGSPSPNDNTSATKTFSISIAPINDAPVFTVPAGLTVSEDAGLVNQTSFATNVRSGPVGANDENSQRITFEVTAADPNAFSVQPTIGADGSFRFQTAPNINSDNANLEVFVKLTDDGASAPTPNENASAIQTISITVTPVNDPPIADAFIGMTTEDTPVTINSADVLAGDVPGPTSDEASQTIRMTQIERTSAKGGTVTPVFSGANIVSFEYRPPANLVGNDTFLYVVSDNGTPSRSGSGTVTISIAGVNDPPQFVKGVNQVVPEDSDLVTVNNWATGILAGPPAATDENSSQTVTFSLSSNNPGLFEQQPALASNGTLTFKPSLDANGTAIVTVTAMDDGSNVAPNVNMSQPQTFMITVNPVNDAPTFTPGANVRVAEDSGTYSQPWASNIAAAAGLLTTPPTATDESSQIVDFTATADRTDLFSVQPTVNNSGGLSFTPARDAFGTAVVLVNAVDRGPTGGMNQNSSITQTLTITIDAANDLPQAEDDSYTTNENVVLDVKFLDGLLSNDGDVDLPADTIIAVAQTTSSSLGAVVVIGEDGSFTYDPSGVTSIQQLGQGQAVQDSFTYQIQDAAGGLSLPATVTINVTGVDDPPIAADDDYSIGVGQSRLLDVLTNDTDIDSTIDPRTIVITAIPVFGTAVVNQTGVIQYTAGPGFRGVDVLGYTVKDAGGNVSNEATVTITINNAPEAVDDSTFTFKNQPIDINVLANDLDLDGTIDPTSVEIVVAPTPGGTTEVLPGGRIRFTPLAGFSGEARFSYVVSDDLGTTSNVARVSVLVQNSQWQNSSNRLDVNNDGFISPIDALIVINYLNRGGETFLPDSGVSTPPFIDPTGDENVTPLDALTIINFLNQSGGIGEGEAELTSQEHVMMVTPEQMVATVGPQVVREIQAALDESRLSVFGESGLDSDSIEPRLPAVGVQSRRLDDPFTAESDSDEAWLESLALSCTSEEFTSSAMEDAVDEFLREMGPYRPE